MFQFPEDPGMHNMADAGSSTRVTYRKNPNFIERIGSSLAGIVVGIALIGVSCYLTFWNEVRTMGYVLV